MLLKAFVRSHSKCCERITLQLPAQVQGITRSVRRTAANRVLRERIEIVRNQGQFPSVFDIVEISLTAKELFVVMFKSRHVFSNQVVGEFVESGTRFYTRARGERTCVIC